MADPRDTLQQQLQKNFPKFGNIRKLCLYQEMASGLYDAGTGSTIENVVSENPVWIIFDSVTQAALSSIKASVETSNIKELQVAIFPTLDLPIDPKERDKIIREDTIVWQVIGVIPDPAEAHWELVVQPVKE